MRTLRATIALAPLALLFVFAIPQAQAQTTYGDVSGNPTNHYPNYACTGSPVGPSVRVFGDDVPPPHQAYAYFDNEPAPPSDFYTNPSAYCFEVTYVATNIWMDGAFTQSHHDKIAQWYVGSGVTPWGPYPSRVDSYGQTYPGSSKGAAAWNSTAYGGSCASGAAQLNSSQQCSQVSSTQWKSYENTMTSGGSPTVLFTDSTYSRSCFSECAAAGYQGCTEQRQSDMFTGTETVTCIVNPSSANTYARPQQTTFQGSEPRYQTVWNSYVYEPTVQYQCSPPGQYSCVPAAAPTVSLSASPTTVSYGSGTTLYWSTTGATSCSAITSNLGHNFGGGATSGAAGSPGLGQNVTFSITCYGAGGSASASASVSVLTYADLYSTIGSSMTVTAGQSNTYYGATYNQGQAASGGSNDLFIFYDSSYNWYTYAYVSAPPIAPGGGVGLSTSYAFSYPGTYYYRLCADWSGTVSESNEGNNCSALSSITVGPAPAPNLYSYVGGSITVTAGQTGTLTGSTYNYGNATASGTFYDLFLIYDTSYNYAYPNGSTYYAHTTPTYSDAIGAGGAVGRTGYYAFNTPGTYYYRMCADWPGGVSETNESDNCSGFSTVTVRPTPPTGLGYSCSTDGTQAYVSWNPTPGAAYGYYIRGSVTNYDHYGATSITYSVTPGASYSMYVYAENTPSNYSDPSGITISCAGAPNLYPYTGGTINVVAGQTATLVGSTYNYGTATAPAGFYDLFLIYDTSYNYSSQNGSNYWAHTDPVYSGAISPSGSVARSGYYTFNNPGTYYYRFCTDWANNVAETVEGDNCGGFGTVNVAPPIPPNPTGLGHSCAADGNSVTLYWTAAPGATDYYVRLYDYATGNYAAYSDLYTGTSITYAATPGRSYIMWVHSRNSTGYSNPPAYHPSSSSTFTCAGYPDLTAGAVSTPASVIPNRTFSMSAPVTNQGTGSSGSFPTLFQVLNSSGTTIATVLTSISGNGYMSLLSGETATASVSYSLPAGTYSVRACANYNQSWQAITPESNYGNNCGPYASFTVAPTGSLSCTVSPTTAKVGDTVTYSASPSGGAGSPYSWNDGQGGSYGTGSSVNRTFTAIGNYSMSVGADNTIQSSYVCTADGQPYITVGCAAPHTASISAAATRVRQGDSTTLTWSGAGINTSCVLSGPGVSQSVAANACAVPTQTTSTGAISTQSRYCVTCDGGIQQCTTVNVIPLYEEF